MIALAAAGVAGWMVVEEPLVATTCVVAADLIAACLMVPKTYRDPASETLATFAIASVGGALAAGAVGSAIAVLISQRRVQLASCTPSRSDGFQADDRPARPGRARRVQGDVPRDRGRGGDRPRAGVRGAASA